MKKVLLFVLTLISIVVQAQEVKAPAVKINITVDRKLYTEKEANGDYMASSQEAFINAVYVATPFDATKLLLVSMGNQMGLQDIKTFEILENKKSVFGIRGTMPVPEKMVMEIYITRIYTEADDEGTALITSAYSEAKKMIYEAEGKKAALSAVVVEK